MENEQICIYCQKNIADTVDHIPSRGLFSTTAGIEFIKVPACSDCNRGFSADEEYFRNFTANVSILSSGSADLLLNTKIKRSVERRPGLALKLFKRMSLVQLRTPDGIDLGPKTKVDIVDEDRKRASAVVQKYVKGLFFHHFGVPLPTQNKIVTTWINPKSPQVIKDMTIKIKRASQLGDVFSYGYDRVPNSQNSVWLLQFFRNPDLGFMALVTTSEFEKLNGR